VRLEEKLYLLKFNPDRETHLRPREEDCRRCPDRPCTHFCPAQVYRWEEDKLAVSYENCLECGSCRVGCRFGSVDWRFPRGGFGVSYRFG
jgi:ferredoxin like protein